MRISACKSKLTCDVCKTWYLVPIYKILENSINSKWPPLLLGWLLGEILSKLITFIVAHAYLFLSHSFQLNLGHIPIWKKNLLHNYSLNITVLLSSFQIALIRCGVDLCDRDYKAIVCESNSPLETEMLDILDKYSPGLWAAVGSGSTGIVNLLVNSWCRINIYKRLPTGSMSLLMYAQRGRQPPELIALLDDYEVTIEFVHATLAGDEIRMQDFLMDSKPCDPYIMDIAHQDTTDGPLIPRSLRDAALAMGHTHVLHLLPEGDYESGQKSTIIKETSEGVASCSDYSSGSNPDSVQKVESNQTLNQIQTDTQFMTIGRAPRLSTFHSEQITASVRDKHFVGGFYFHDPEPDPDEEYQFQGDPAFLSNPTNPMGSVRTRQIGGYHDYGKNWEVATESHSKEPKKKDKGKKNKDKEHSKDKDADKTKSKLCVVM